MRNLMGIHRLTSINTTRRAPSGNAPTIALIGCGAIAETFYMPAIAKYPSVLEKLILVDKDKARAQKLASEFGVANYLSDYHAVLNKVDGAIVAVPHQMHYRISVDFLMEGVHVLCEKPLAESVVEAKDMIAQAEKTGVTIAVNNTRRLFPSLIKVKELISNGTIGDLLSIKYFDGHEFSWPTASGFYFNSTAAPKGVVLDIGAHAFDLICWWLEGKPQLLSCENDSFGGCEAVASIKLKNGNCLGDVKLSWLSNLQNKYIIDGELGMIEGNIYEWWHLNITPKSGKKKKVRINSKQKDYSDFGSKLFDNFIDVIKRGEKPLISAKDVLGSIGLIEECYIAASRFSMPWNETLEMFDDK